MTSSVPHRLSFQLRRVMIIVLISFLHLVSLSLLSLSLALGSGGLVEAGAIGVDWLALIVMAVFLLHRIKRPQREYIQPRSLFCFAALSVTGGANFTLFVVRLATDVRGLDRDFEPLKYHRAAAYSVLVIAGVTTLLGLAGFYFSNIETRPKLRPFISRPMFDWHPHPVDGKACIPGAPAVHWEARDPSSQYVPGLIPQWSPRTPTRVLVIKKAPKEWKAVSRGCPGTKV